MCGIAGLIAPRGGARDELSRIVGAMADALRHRGPDSAGSWVEAEAGVAFGHRRLAIIDLSREGHQPMLSASGRYVLTLNGEIYNFQSLRRELGGLGHQFRGHSDTEVLLAAIEQWGLEKTLPRTVGMFAFALFDRRARVLHLVCDRLGKKPLYFGRVGASFLFASELKALARHPDFAPEIDRGGLTQFMRRAYVPAPETIYQGVFKLPPGRRLSLPLERLTDGSDADLLAAARPYWSVRRVAEAGLAAPLRLDEREATDRLEAVLAEAVACRMIADVPLGALLSGGIDSSLVVSLMQQQAERPVRTFTVGFQESGFDEAAGAQAVARHLGTEHTEIVVTPAEARAVIPRLPEIYDEPFADQSEIPTFLVAQLARQHVTVALSGDGGDEGFGGYNRHFLGQWLRRRLGLCPPVLRRAAARGMLWLSPDIWDTWVARAARVLPRSAIPPAPGARIRKLADILVAADTDDVYRRVTSRWPEPDAVVRSGFERAAPAAPELADPALRMMYLDTVGYLPDDILVKVDRASMAVSLEVRAPLLDHRLLELAWRLPLELKIRGRQGKWLLRRVLERHVPRALTDRPKQGFDIPLDAWLRGPLRDWAEDLLAEPRLAGHGLLEPRPIRAAWAAHLSGRQNRGAELWTVLVFQAWHEHWRRAPAAARPAPPVPAAAPA